MKDYLNNHLGGALIMTAITSWTHVAYVWFTEHRIVW